MMELFSDELTGIAGLVEKYNRFLITSTADPDGDSVGSQLALYNIILAQIAGSKDKTVTIVNEIYCPERYGFLPDSDRIITLQDVKTETFDVGFVLDGGSERTGNIKGLYDKCAVKIIIDHHKFGSGEKYDIELRNPDLSSTSEIVYQFIENRSWRAELTQDIAASIYLSIIFDTGFFRHSNTSPRTLTIVSKLIETGIDFSEIAEKGMLQREFSAQKLLGMVLELAQTGADGRIAWSIVTEEMMNRTNASKEDQEGLIEQLSIVKGVDAAVLFKEDKQDTYKISFRSGGLIDVGKLARSLDNEGGGHERAAGCLLKGNIDDIRQRVIGEIGTRLK